MRNKIVIVLCLFLLSTSCQHKIQNNLENTISAGAMIEAVDVIGNKQISSDTIRQTMKSKPGRHVSLIDIKSDIESLHSLGFKDVRVEESPGTGFGMIVTFRVKEE